MIVTLLFEAFHLDQGVGKKISSHCVIAFLPNVRISHFELPIQAQNINV